MNKKIYRWNIAWTVLVITIGITAVFSQYLLSVSRLQQPVLESPEQVNGVNVYYFSIPESKYGGYTSSTTGITVPDTIQTKTVVLHETSSGLSDPKSRLKPDDPVSVKLVDKYGRTYYHTTDAETASAINTFQRPPSNDPLVPSVSAHAIVSRNGDIFLAVGEGSTTPLLELGKPTYHSMSYGNTNFGVEVARSDTEVKANSPLSDAEKRGLDGISKIFSDTLGTAPDYIPHRVVQGSDHSDGDVPVAYLTGAPVSALPVQPLVIPAQDTASPPARQDTLPQGSPQAAPEARIGATESIIVRPNSITEQEYRFNFDKSIWEKRDDGDWVETKTSGNPLEAQLARKSGEKAFENGVSSIVVYTRQENGWFPGTASSVQIGDRVYSGGELKDTSAESIIGYIQSISVVTPAPATPPQQPAQPSQPPSPQAGALSTADSLMVESAELDKKAVSSTDPLADYNRAQDVLARVNENIARLEQQARTASPEERRRIDGDLSTLRQIQTDLPSTITIIQGSIPIAALPPGITKIDTLGGDSVNIQVDVDLSGNRRVTVKDSAGAVIARPASGDTIKTALDTVGKQLATAQPPDTTSADTVNLGDALQLPAQAGPVSFEFEAQHPSTWSSDAATFTWDGNQWIAVIHRDYWPDSTIPAKSIESASLLNPEIINKAKELTESAAEGRYYVALGADNSRYAQFKINPNDVVHLVVGKDGTLRISDDNGNPTAVVYVASPTDKVYGATKVEKFDTELTGKQINDAKTVGSTATTPPATTPVQPTAGTATPPPGTTVIKYVYRGNEQKRADQVILEEYEMEFASGNDNPIDNPENYNVKIGGTFAVLYDGKYYPANLFGNDGKPTKTLSDNDRIKMRSDTEITITKKTTTATPPIPPAQPPSQVVTSQQGGEVDGKSFEDASAGGTAGPSGPSLPVATPPLQPSTDDQRKAVMAGILSRALGNVPVELTSTGETGSYTYTPAGQQPIFIRYQAPPSGIPDQGEFIVTGGGDTLNGKRFGSTGTEKQFSGFFGTGLDILDTLRPANIYKQEGNTFYLQDEKRNFKGTLIVNTDQNGKLIAAQYRPDNTIDRLQRTLPTGKRLDYQAATQILQIGDRGDFPLFRGQLDVQDDGALVLTTGGKTSLKLTITQNALQNNFKLEEGFVQVGNEFLSTKASTYSSAGTIGESITRDEWKIEDSRNRLQTKHDIVQVVKRQGFGQLVDAEFTIEKWEFEGGNPSRREIYQEREQGQYQDIDNDQILTTITFFDSDGKPSYFATIDLETNTLTYTPETPNNIKQQAERLFFRNRLVTGRTPLGQVKGILDSATSAARAGEAVSTTIGIFNKDWRRFTESWRSTVDELFSGWASIDGATHQMCDVWTDQSPVSVGLGRRDLPSAYIAGERYQNKIVNDDGTTSTEYLYKYSFMVDPKDIVLLNLPTEDKFVEFSIALEDRQKQRVLVVLDEENEANNHPRLRLNGLPLHQASAVPDNRPFDRICIVFDNPGSLEGKFKTFLEGDLTGGDRLLCNSLVKYDTEFNTRGPGFLTNTFEFDIPQASGEQQQEQGERRPPARRTAGRLQS
ncbi:hypothetical protein HY491_02855 [Candidatus Woesearchaeota archaeon]|nr:hypothetical protein [Candidatus Woesearchaeota archaeon]